MRSGGDDISVIRGSTLKLRNERNPRSQKIRVNPT
jgi:hypothetical protein